MGKATTPGLEWDHAPSRPELVTLDALVDESLAAMTGHVGSPLGIVVRADGKVVAGVHGLIWGGCCELVSIWVDDGYRHGGLGRRLLDAVEADARRRECDQLVLFTHYDGEPALYLRAGFEVVGRLPDYPVGHTA